MMWGSALPFPSPEPHGEPAERSCQGTLSQQHTANLSQEPARKCGLSSPVCMGKASHGSVLLLFSGA